MMSKHNLRIKELRLESQRSQQEIAGILELSQGAYSQIERGHYALSMEQAIRLCEEYKVSLDWLATGEGHKRKINLQNGYIPLIDSRIHAGYIKKGSKIFNDNLEMYRIPGFTDGEYRIFEVEGNSMRPTLVPNDYLICTQLKELYDFVDGTICAIVTDHEIFVKRVSKDSSDPDRIILKCDNHAFPSETIALESINEVWIVNAKLTTTFLALNQDHENRMKTLEKKLEELEKRLG